ncbi:MAG: redox-regulated ATPase YchF [Gemmatimonadetes bacterium]|nr:redox-regulated ATPase YchF [Gemmatimonadota bacterium]
MLKAGIVGLPNVGKSSLFNALTSQSAPAENYPFCTVEPNVGMVEVPDARLHRIAEIHESRSRIPTVVQFVDIAGLVEGASLGEGLGNKFLANIREVDAIVHVVRCFDDPDVTHVLGGVDPIRDRGIVNTELQLADLDVVEKRLDRTAKKAKSGGNEALREQGLLERLKEHLGRGLPARGMEIASEEVPLLRSFQLLSARPVLYVANVGESDLPSGENKWTKRLREAVRVDEAEAMVIGLSARIEAELVALEPAERTEFLHDIGLEEPGLHRLIRATYELLGLITFFTAGEKESRAWTVRRDTRAPGAAGEIHSDFERGFIRAETFAYDDLEVVGSIKAVREKGLIRSEGKEYVVKDGDIILFRFNV